MPLTELTRRVEALRRRIDEPHDDPATLHDDLQQVITLMERAGDSVPADLREAVEELQAEIVEDFYDNLPV